MTVCTAGMLYLVFKKVAKDIAEANGYKYVETPFEGVRKGCKYLIITDNVNQRVGMIAKRWIKETGGNVIFYAVTEGYPSVTPNTGFGSIIKDITIVTPSEYSKRFLEESGFNVEAVIPHGVKVPEKIKGFDERDKKIIYRSYYLKRKFPPYGIKAVKKAIDEKLPVEIYVRDDMYPNDLEPRHKALSQLLPFKVENSFKTSEEQVINQFSSNLYFLNLSDGGGFELEILENMAVGTPVITSYFPPISEYYPKNELVIETKGEWYEQYPYLVIKHHIYYPEDMYKKIMYALTLTKDEWRKLSNQVREQAKKYEYKKVYSLFSKLI